MNDYKQAIMIISKGSYDAKELTLRLAQEYPTIFCQLVNGEVAPITSNLLIESSPVVNETTLPLPQVYAEYPIPFKHFYTTDEENLIIELYQDGHSIQYIANISNATFFNDIPIRTRTAIQCKLNDLRILKKVQIRPKKKIQYKHVTPITTAKIPKITRNAKFARYSADEMEFIIKLYAEGKRHSEIAQKCNKYYHKNELVRTSSAISTRISSMINAK